MTNKPTKQHRQEQVEQRNEPIMSQVIDTVVLALYKANAYTPGVVKSYVDHKKEIDQIDPAKAFEEMHKIIEDNFPRTRDGVVGL